MKPFLLSLSTLLLSLSCTVKVANAQFGRVVGLRLVRVPNGATVMDLTNSSNFYLNNTSPINRYAVVAVTSAGTITQVRFGWNGNANYRNEKEVPYQLCGGSPILFFPCIDLVAGTHTISATVTDTSTSYVATFRIHSGFAPPIAPVAPKAPTVPVAPKAPTVPVVPVAPKTPVVPVAPVAPKAPTIPIAPVAPKAPVVPVATKAPVVPVVPVAPKAPTVPVAPVAPKAPTVPVTPMAPVVPVVPPVAPKAQVVPVATKAPMVPVAPKAPLAPVVPPVPKATTAPKAPTRAPATPVAPPRAATTGFTPIRINCGGLAYNDTMGRFWDNDRFFTGGASFAVNASISDTNDDPLYTCERYGPSTYSIPVPIGTYTVVLHFAEIYHDEPGDRVFDATVESKSLPDIDIVQIGGEVPFKAITRYVSAVTVYDGFLTIRFRENVPKIDTPKISAIEVLDASAHAPTNAPVVAPPPSPPTAFQPILINCGGGAVVDSRRRAWSADSFFTGGETFATNIDILGTDDDVIYNSNRWGQPIYTIPVPSGTYEVILHLSETYFTAPGSRVFDVNVEKTIVQDIDIIQLGGGIPNSAVTKVTSAVVIDGFLTIRMKNNVPYADNPTIAGIEINRIGEAPPMVAPVAPPPTAPTPFQTVLISCGGVAYNDTLGRSWQADAYFDGGNTFASSANPISNTADDQLYQSDRWGPDFSYEIPVPEGNYIVVLHFAEIYLFFTDPGARVFDILVEGDMIADLDIVKESGAIYTAMTRQTAIVPVMDGFLTIQFLANVPAVDNPKISAIEVRRSGDHFSHALTGGPYTAVDLDSSGAELVAVDAKESHTHGPGNVINTYTWREGGNIIGSGREANLNLTVGLHDVTLTIVDSSGSEASDDTVIAVKVKGFPELFTLEPLTGPISGGTVITLNGQDIGNATAVRFGRALVTGPAITVINSGTITVVTPVAAVGVPVSVSVITPIGESSTKQFTYVSSTPIEFAIAELLTIAAPTAVAFGPDGKLYIGTGEGKLARITLNDNYDAVVNSVIATIDPDRYILGLAFDPLETAKLENDLSVYISTSDIYHGQYRNSFGAAINGKIQVVRGANLDQVTNIITGLPVSEIDHAVNGISFGDNGELYIAVGSNTNAGIPGKLSGSQRMRENYFSAAILVAHLGKPRFNGFITYDADIDGNPITGFGPNGVEIFAAGTRNPFGVLFHSNGKVYATDNGPNKNLGNIATGCGDGQNATEYTEKDKLHYIKRGGYYGHPNHKRAQTDPRQCVWYPAAANSTAEYTAPMMQVDSSTDGIIEYEADHFNGQLRGDLILSKYNDALFRVILSPDGETVNPFSNPMIRLGGNDGLTVTQAPDGTLIDGRHSTNRCFFFKAVEAPSSAMDIKAVFPRRGGLAGGSKLMIFGVNFSGSPTVTVGGLPCSNPVLVSSKKIECTLPGGTVGKKDVVVQIGGVSDTFANGYRYITGFPL